MFVQALVMFVQALVMFIQSDIIAYLWVHNRAQIALSHTLGLFENSTLHCLYMIVHALYSAISLFHKYTLSFSAVNVILEDLWHGVM